MQDDMPLTNFGADTEVATPPVADEAVASEQTAPVSEASGSEDVQAQPEQPEDNPIAESEQSGRPEKRDRTAPARIGELSGKVRERDAYIEQLEAQLAKNQAMGGLTPLTPDENGYLDPAKLDERTAQVADQLSSSKVAALEQRLERNNVANRLDSEGTLIEKLLADKGLDTNPIHAETIKELVSERVNDNLHNLNGLKNISAIKIAERYLKGIEAASRTASSQTAQNLNQTAAEAAVSPESAPQGVDPNSDDALAARLADIKF